MSFKSTVLLRLVIRQVGLAEAFRQGVAAYAQDVVIQGQPWPFDPAVITVPVHVIHGQLDTALPIAHSRHTADLISGSVLRILHGHGHMTAVSELPIIASELVLGTHSRVDRRS